MGQVIRSRLGEKTLQLRGGRDLFKVVTEARRDDSDSPPWLWPLHHSGTAHLCMLWKLGFQQSMPTRTLMILILVIPCFRDHTWPRAPSHDPGSHAGGTSERRGTPRTHSSPTCRNLVLGARRDRRNHTCQGSGRKHMALSHGVI